MDIDLAKTEDLNEIMSIFELCKAEMKKTGLQQWIDEEPGKKEIEGSISKKELFITRSGGRIVACFVLNSVEEPHLGEIKWKFEDANPLYIHRLAVLPEMQGKGIAKEMMSFAERYGKERGCKSIRLDTYGENKLSNALYKKLGYTQAGAMTFPGYLKGEYFSYEKKL
jgi:ribosomal protein S18 acetylase RimI-like enzyme